LTGIEGGIEQKETEGRGKGMEAREWGRRIREHVRYLRSLRFLGVKIPPTQVKRELRRK
jgi:hypothetical protein